MTLFRHLCTANFKLIYNPSCASPALHCKSNSYTWQLVMGKALLEHSSISPVATLISKSRTTSRNVESLNAPRKRYFWLAGQILPPWVPVTLLQLLGGFPVPTGSSSGNSIWPLFSLDRPLLVLRYRKFGAGQGLGRVLALFQDCKFNANAKAQQWGQ